MSTAEIVLKARMFQDIDVRRMYTAIAMANEWMRETGGTLDEFLRDMEENCAKKPAI